MVESRQQKFVKVIPHLLSAGITEELLVCNQPAFFSIAPSLHDALQAIALHVNCGRQNSDSIRNVRRIHFAPILQRVRADLIRVFLPRLP